MPSTRNILVGAAAVHIGAADADKPTMTANTPYAVTGTGWRNVGFTQDGLEVSYEPDFGDVEVDQLLDSALTFKSGMRVTVNTTFAEATLQNLEVVWAQVTGRRTTGTGFDGEALATGEEELGMEAGSLGDAPQERQLIAIGRAPATGTPARPRERVYHARRVISVDTSAHSLRRTEATVFPVSFRLLPGEVAGAEYGTIRDRFTAAAPATGVRAAGAPETDADTRRA